MKFRNTASVDLKFKIDGAAYEVSVGGVCDIPDRIAYCIKTRGLPMEPAPEKASEKAPEKPAASEKPAAASPSEMSEAELEAATAPESAPTQRKRK